MVTIILQPDDLQPAVFAAIVTSPKLRRYLRGEVAPDLVIVDQAKVADFEEQLRWASLQVSRDLSVKDPKIQKQPRGTK